MHCPAAAQIPESVDELVDQLLISLHRGVDVPYLAGHLTSCGSDPAVDPLPRPLSDAELSCFQVLINHSYPGAGPGRSRVTTAPPRRDSAAGGHQPQGTGLRPHYPTVP